MAGLLDGYGTDPIAQGLLGLSGALLTPRAQGGGLGAGFAAFNQGAMQAGQLRQQMQQNALRERLLGAQIDNFTSEAEQRKALAKAREQQTANEEAARAAKIDFLSSLTQPQPMGFRDASIAMGGTAPAGYSAPQQATGRIQMTPQLYGRAKMAGLSDAEIKALVESPDWGRQEVARLVDMADPQGRPAQQQYDRFGQPIGGAIPKAYERRTVDLGGAVQERDPYTGQMLGSLPKTQTPDSLASNALTMRGQNMADSRAREGLALQRAGMAADGAMGKPPAGYRWKADGSLEAITGGPADPATKADKAPTESQSKDFLFASRADAADRLATEALKKASVSGASINDALGGIPIVGGIPAAGQRMFLSDDTQKYQQAKRDFINAVLRKESGAVIGKDEFDSADKQYFPQVNDGAAVIEQKAEARRRAVEGIKLGAGPLGKQFAAPLNPQAPAAQAPAGGMDLQEMARRELARRQQGGASGSF
jgi:hypothetical protein